MPDASEGLALYEAVFEQLVRETRQPSHAASKPAGEAVVSAMLGETAPDGVTADMALIIAWEGLAPQAVAPAIAEARRANYMEAAAWIRSEQEAGRVRSDGSAEHIVALLVAAGSLPFTMPSVMRFLYGTDELSPEEHKAWRELILRMISARE